ncbi:M24 family metallopeptidase [Bradyrhizobium sp. 5.13L]|jgi:Xaa-Pro dipeptidase
MSFDEASPYPLPNLSSLKRLAAARGLEAVVAMSPENFAYATGAYIMTVRDIRPRQAFAVLPAKGEPAVLVCSIERQQMQIESWIQEIRVYTEFVDEPADALVALLKDMGIASGKVGIDLDYLPVNSFLRLRSLLPEIELVDTHPTISTVRAIKSGDEVAYLEKTTKQTHHAVLHAMAASKLGETERTMANRIATGIINNGADGIRFLVFGTGKRSSQTHALASEKVTQLSEIIRLDVAGTYGAWCSDLARTYSTGKPTAQQSDTYAALWDIQTATIAMVRPGMTAEEPFHYCKQRFEQAGLKFTMPHIGHSLGVELHESPLLRPGEKRKLEEGMVINIEPLITDSAGETYHLEDLFVVTANGPRLLTMGFAPKQIPVIGEPIAM